MMREVRLAGKGEVTEQKEIWKLCFKDSDDFIEFFYTNRYKEDQTMLLLHDEVISAMLTMVPVKIITGDTQSYNSTMLYAVATHPKCQNRGFATQLMDYTHQYLKEKNSACSVLVPAEKQLFDFYRRLGYEDGFYIREFMNLPVADTAKCMITDIDPEEYNQIRNQQLSGRLFISYANEEIIYQKKLSQKSGADIYRIEMGKVQGCAAIERLNSDKIIIKEILIPDRVLAAAVKQIANLLQAKEYVMRTPAFLGEHLAGTVRPFGMIKTAGESGLKITPRDLAYLGFAFD
ncbi:MAG: GNAT family N-acetyltransferase [Dehalobacterium sp.]